MRTSEGVEIMQDVVLLMFSANTSADAIANVVWCLGCSNGPSSRRLELLFDATRGVNAGHMGCSEDCCQKKRLSFYTILGPTLGFKKSADIPPTTADK